MTTKAEYIERIREAVEEDFVKDVDGFWYYSLGEGGLLSEHDLVIIADLLAEKNKEWNEHINKYFNENNS